MLPTGHIEFTWAGLHLLQSRAGLFREADFRWIAIATLAPDLLDKPLALTVYRTTDAALFWGHNLWLHLAVWALALLVMKRRALPYLFAFSGHLLADRMWGFRESLFYPLGAGVWHPWVHVGTPGAMLGAYVEIIRTTPILIAFEVIGLVLLAWVAWERQLWRWPRLLSFVQTGGSQEIELPRIARTPQMRTSGEAESQP